MNTLCIREQEGSRLYVVANHTAYVWFHTGQEQEGSRALLALSKPQDAQARLTVATDTPKWSAVALMLALLSALQARITA